MTDLITRLTEGEGADRELDFSIAFAFQFRPIRKKELAESFTIHERKHDYATAWIAHCNWRNQFGVPAYTDSLDACIALAEKLMPEYRINMITRKSLSLVSIRSTFDKGDWGNGEHKSLCRAFLIALIKTKESSK